MCGRKCQTPETQRAELCHKHLRLAPAPVKAPTRRHVFRNQPPPDFTRRRPEYLPMVGAGQHQLTTLGFWHRAWERWGGTYDYSRAVYTRSSANVTIICRTHGPFDVVADAHIRRVPVPPEFRNAPRGCPGCSIEDRRAVAAARDRSAYRLPRQEFIAKAEAAHGKGRYAYPDVEPGGRGEYLGTQQDVAVVCPFEGHGVWYPEAKSHLNGHGCPRCKESRGEREVARVLVGAGLTIAAQWSHDELVHLRRLYFDFAVLDAGGGVRHLVEFDGDFHRMPVPFGKGPAAEARALAAFADLRVRDQLKDSWAVANGYRVVRLSDAATVEADLRAHHVIPGCEHRGACAPDARVSAA